MKTQIGGRDGRVKPDRDGGSVAENDDVRRYLLSLTEYIGDAQLRVDLSGGLERNKSPRSRR